jgi:EAL domain-containing protein (putative c-di-GMP-specific phosphodiesterase class I)
VKSEKTAAIVNTIAGLGHTLNVPISAEGVESEQIRNALEKFGCTEAQGWLFGRAISAESVRSFLNLTQEGSEPRPEEGTSFGVPSRARRGNR